MRVHHVVAGVVAVLLHTAVGLQAGLGLLLDLGQQRQVQLVGQLQRRGRVAGLQARLLDGRGRNALAQHGEGLVDERADHAGGEEAAGVVDHDGRLLDLLGDVEGPGQRFVRGVCPGDDLQQRHLVHGREEVQANEVLLALARPRRAW